MNISKHDMQKLEEGFFFRIQTKLHKNDTFIVVLIRRYQY